MVLQGGSLSWAPFLGTTTATEIFAEAFVGHTKRNRFGDAIVFVESVFDTTAANIFTAADEMSLMRSTK